ncbi:MAG: malto-oligosyltrehalose synthase [Elusimicrobiota bacterium]|nr:MAG: malto-oligosyltrehalose synthase [Elusimicrobiota bacterium]
MDADVHVPAPAVGRVRLPPRRRARGLPERARPGRGVFLPYFRASPGGNPYAVADPGLLSPELGGEAEFDRMCARLAAAGLGHVADIVPNHMGVTDNPYWWDVLERGPASRFASWFDVDWAPAKPELAGKVLLPVLEGHFGEVLEAGLIRLGFGAGRFHVSYRDRRFPVAPESLPWLFSRAKCDGLPAGRLASRCLEAFEGRPGRPESFDALEGLLERQHYRLCHWRAASDEINYRRFFNFNDLAAVRAEDPGVFETGHRLLFKLLEEGKVQGVRVDHPDGLYDPPAYFARLQDAWARARPGEGPLFVAVEKILDRKEALHEDWRVSGTVGYDFMNALSGIYVDRGAAGAMSAAYEGFIGRGKDVAELSYRAKRLFLATYLAGEIESLGHRLDALSETSRRWRDLTRRSLTAAVRETIACFPVYRTYVSPRGRAPSEADRRYIEVAIAKARRAAPELGHGVFDFLEAVLLLKVESGEPPARRRAWRDFVLRFQQLTAPVMAKGIEDTVFYIDHRLVSLNEVGASPGRFGESASEFHRLNASRAERWPGSLAAASTHDTKRSEDARLRLHALSELPAEWRSAASRWAILNERHKTMLDGVLEPDRDTEYFVYQTLLAAWPDRDSELAAFAGRVRAYVRKSVREAKRRTDWLNPDGEYEAAVDKFLEGVLARGTGNAFLAEFAPFQRRVSALGKLNSLSALVLRLGSPGPVDVYQGDELWNYRLTDPDNRAPVDFDRRARALGELSRLLDSPRPRAAVAARLLARADDGLIKLHVLREGLLRRRRDPDLFLRGSYEGLTAEGPRAGEAAAFARAREGRWLVAAGARFFSRREPGAAAWDGTRIALPKACRARTFRDALTHRRARVEARGGRRFLSAPDLLGVLPGALLLGTDGH